MHSVLDAPFFSRRHARFLGSPAVTVPAGFTTEGIPFGIDLASISETDLLSYAYSFEQATTSTAAEFHACIAGKFPTHGTGAVVPIEDPTTNNNQRARAGGTK
jgi:hypothetical protein